MCLQNNSEFIKQGNIGDGYLRLKRCQADNQNKITTSEEEDDQQQGVTGGIGAVQF